MIATLPSCWLAEQLNLAKGFDIGKNQLARQLQTL